MKLQQLLSFTRKAVDTYQMIQPGDKIAIGISGGKDSLTLLYALHGLKRFYPNPFEIEAITVDLGFDGFDTSEIAQLCASLDVPYTVVKTDIGEIIFNERKEKNPCSLCANLRRGALNDNAKKLGCNKVALGHHKDDAIETFLMSMLYEGRVNCFSPKTHMDRQDLTIIRPMIYIDEYMTKKATKDFNYPVIKNPCPADGKTNRQDIKELVARLNKEIPGSKKNIFGALNNSERLFIWDKDKIK